MPFVESRSGRNVAAVIARNARDTVALAAMRTVRGCRDVPVSASIGDPESSLETHRLLTGFTYPSLPGFDPDTATERVVCECSRLVTIAADQLTELVRSRFITSAEAAHFAFFGFRQLIVAAYRREIDDEQFAGSIFTIQPRMAHVLCARLRLPLLPMFAGGVAPTRAALTSGALFAPYFSRWNAELQRTAPALTSQGGPTAVLAQIATQVHRRSYRCSVSLPFFLAVGNRLEIAIETLEASTPRTARSGVDHTEYTCEHVHRA
jgi:hypothetical protein